jgi:hypothetical protein
MFILACCSLNAQNSPVKWSFKLNKLNNEKAEFYAKADIEKGWNIYSVYMGEDGPIPTSFSFDEIINGKIEGKVIEKSEKITVHDDLFDMQVIKFKDIAEFTQSLSGSNLSVKGSVVYMCCDSKRCLPPTEVNFDLK